MSRRENGEGKGIFTWVEQRNIGTKAHVVENPQGQSQTEQGCI